MAENSRFLAFAYTYLFGLSPNSPKSAQNPLKVIKTAIS